MTTRLTLVVLLLGYSVTARAADTVDYQRDVKPLLQQRCYACHGALRQKGKLRLDTAAALRQGGRRGPAVTPGDAADSWLIAAVTGDGVPRMPPADEGKPLTESQISLLRAWINQGAVGPAAERPEEDPREHWSFRRPVRAALPPVRDAAWARNPVDAFIARGHERQGLTPNPPAAREALLRRVYLDLTGLPPSRAELHAFLADDSPGAYEGVVERLLNSPQYGERWARHWMDVWRYSDWYGRRAVPDVWNSAPQVWRWRDWIVRSLNADKGYDRMVQEMLAADEVAPGDDEAVVATGYLVRNWYALNPNQWLRDVVEHTGKAFLGLTLNCAHCHDHKYDPIRQEEYFRFRAFFEPLELRQDRVPGEADPGPFQKYEYAVLRKVARTGLIRVFDEKPDAKTYMYHLGDERSRMDRPPVGPAPPTFLGGDAVKVEPVALPAEAAYPGLKAFVRAEELRDADKAVAAAGDPLALATALARRKALDARLAADDAKHAPGDVGALAKSASLAERRASLAAAEEARLRADEKRAAARGQNAAALKAADQQLTAAAQAVGKARQALARDTAEYTPLTPVYPKTSSGRRRALAAWLTSRENPLTARVAVNHVWLRHFGKPLVESVADFGRNGKRPSHPELLDWLAVEFMESGWSMKHLHRLLVTSAAYRQQAGAPPGNPNLAVDPENRFLWQFARRRAEAEAVRDSVLSVAGSLDPAAGGPALENTQELASRRRSLYFSVYPEDGGNLKMLTLFDAPDPCDCYRRGESIVPQQALALTNGPLLLEQSRRLAQALSAEVPEESGFIVAAFEQILTRRPTAPELAACREFLRKQSALFTPGNPAPGKEKGGAIPPSPVPAIRAREGLVRALFSHDDFVTIR